MKPSVTAALDSKTGTLTITMPVDLKDPQPSKTGNTLLIATTHGAVETDIKLNGQNLRLNVNAYIYAKPKPGKEAA
jgi:hypothetical protein